ncbi:MAG TPA: TRAP transporter small permease subunit [Gammaproteobacteria bacterium]
MLESLLKLRRRMDSLVDTLTAIGSVIILVQTGWISYGVVMRYVFNAPDRMVTEATAMLLFPVAFAGLAFALKEDAYPKVSLLVDALPPALQRAAEVLNLVLMTAIGGFFAVAAVSATIRSFHSGSASEILLWPRYLFWAPVALMLVVFVLYALLRLALALLGEHRTRAAFDAAHSPDI